ncbi:hypothetical protein [Variovorax boronicumulans]|uniref:hypothetical protein n=1 Tax=Variovorax boronicumulans TaxID=436515 RepID=UPI0027847580|nr:hypothetical protein [Variovorax boronicumulans]MDQ0042248.1 hypothetical protein [Variovorax boronicumulans]
MTESKFLSLRQIFEEDQRLGKKGVGDLFSSAKVQEQASHLCVFEDRDALGLPNIVIPADNDLDSFFADIATYFPERAPISAYSHVVDAASHQALVARSKVRNKAPRDKRELSALIGLTLGEALSNLRGTSNQTALPNYSLCKRTLSYCVARAAFLHPTLATSEIVSRWLRIRHSTGMDSSSATAQSINQAVELIKGNISTEEEQPELRDVFETISGHLRKRVEREYIAAHLTSFYPGLRKTVPLLYDAYDNRISAFSATVKAIRDESKGETLDAISVAFFCNLILPGSFSHVGLIERLLPTLPSSMLWYGLFAGSSDEFSWTSSVGSIAQKLFRDLTTPFDITQRPTCDLSIEEYDVLARLPLRSEVLKPTQAKAVLVSLYPGIEVYVRSTVEDDEGSERNALASMMIERNVRLSRVRDLLRHADQILEEERYSEQSSRSSLKTNRRPR